MSIHYLRHWPEGNWVFDHTRINKSKKEKYIDYISTLMKGMSTGLFDILGHADVIKSPGDSLAELIPEEVEKILHATKMNHMAIEINTSGLRKNILSTYPSIDWLPLIKKLNVPITIGSDAHRPAQVAFKFDDINKQIFKFGIKKFVTFEKRVMKAVN